MFSLVRFAPNWGFGAEGIVSSEPMASFVVPSLKRIERRLELIEGKIDAALHQLEHIRYPLGIARPISPLIDSANAKSPSPSDSAEKSANEK